MLRVLSRFDRARVRVSPCSLMVACCCSVLLPTAGIAQTAKEARADRELPHVQVNRDELRIVFPRDTARRWGWPATPAEPPNAPRYSWRMEVDAVQGPRDLRFDVRSNIPFPTSFRSLADLLGAGHGLICRYGMATTCGDLRMTGTAEKERPVLVLRDSALISWGFALRPRFVRLTNDRPERSFVWDSVRIEYGTPDVRSLDSATRAGALRARRRESLERFRVQRGIMGGRGLANRIWLIVGDSLPLILYEVQHLEDLSISGQRDLTDSGWVVLDPRIARLVKPSDTAASARAPRPDEAVAVLDYGPPRAYLEALRPGATIVRVRGVHGRLDAALDSDSPPGVVEADLLVTRPPHRLEIVPRPDTLRVGQQLEARVRLYDAKGESTDRVPVELVCMGCTGNAFGGEGLIRSYYFGDGPTRLSSNEPGRMAIVARLDGLADTLSIVVVDSTATPKRR